MPGAPIQRVTPESFHVWKQQKDELKEQVRFSPKNVSYRSLRLAANLAFLQALRRADAQRQADIASGQAAMTGTVMEFCLAAYRC